MAENGIHYSTGNTLNFTTNGTTWATLTSGGTFQVSSISATTTTAPFTTGSVIFQGSGGTLSQNNSNLFWDNVNNRLGIGTNSPSQVLQVVGGGIFSSSINISGGFVMSESGNVHTFTAPVTNRTIRFITNSQSYSLFPTGNFTIGTTTDAGYKLDVNGSGRIGDTNYYLTLTNGGSDGGIFRVGGASYGYAELVSYSLRLNGGHTLYGTGGSNEFGLSSEVTPTASVGANKGSIVFKANNAGTGGGTWAAYTNTLAFNFLKKETTGLYTSLLALNGNSNNVGIGTITPTYKLDVFGSGTTAGISSNVGLNIQPVAAPIVTSLTYTLLSGSSLGVGTYYYRVTYYNAIGETSASNSITVITLSGSQVVQLNNIPISTDTTVIGRKIYRSKLTDASASYGALVGTISNNTGTTYTDSLPDSDPVFSGNLPSRAIYAKANTTVNYISVGGVRSMIADPSLTTFGVNAGAAITVAPAVTLFGAGAGLRITNGPGNTLFGFSAGASIIGGSQNVAMGEGALSSGVVSGSYNIGLGPYVLNREGSFNIAMGYYTANSLTGSRNVLIGSYIGSSTSSYNDAIIIGHNATPLSATSFQINIGNTIYGRTNTGNVMIGTTTDAGYKLDVNGTSAFRGIVRIFAEQQLRQEGITQTFTSSLGIFRFSAWSNGGLTAYLNAWNYEGYLNFAVNIGTSSTAVASAVLELTSTTRGFLPPRMTSAQRDAISSPATGLTVYQTTNNYLSLFNGTNWQNIVSPNSAGNVVIGTTADAGFKLNVASTTGVCQVAITSAANSLADLNFINAGYPLPRWTIRAIGTPDGSSGNLTFQRLASTFPMTITSSDNVLIGTTTDAGYKLDIVGNQRNTILFSSTTLTENGLYLVNTAEPNLYTGNASPSIILEGRQKGGGTSFVSKGRLAFLPTQGATVGGDFRFEIWNGSSYSASLVAGIGSISIASDGAGQISYIGSGSSTITGPARHRFVGGGPLGGSPSAGVCLVGISNTYSQSSTSNSEALLRIFPTINQTGTGTGIFRGINVDPTLTSITATDNWRSIEWTNSLGWGLYGSGTSPNYLQGNVLIGKTTNSGQKLQVSGDTLLQGGLTANTVTTTGTTTALDFYSSQSSGDEGGEIRLNRPETNTTVSGGTTIDMYQNRLRIFESGGTNRGVFIDLTKVSSTVGTNLVVPRISSGVDSSGNTTAGAFTIVSSVIVPANTFATGDVVSFKMRMRKSGTNGTVNYRMSANSTLNLTGSQTIGVFNAGATIVYGELSRTLVVKGATSEVFNSSITNVQNDVLTSTSAVSSLSIDWTVDQYIMFNINQSSNLDTTNISYYSILEI